MQIGRMAAITKILVEEGLGFLTESRSEPEKAQKAITDGKEGAESEKGGEDEEATALAKQNVSDAELAKRLRKTLERLGPTFVKFGQMLGTRVDLFSEAFLEELGKLHSDVAPYPTPQAREIIEEELGRKVDEVFEDFPDEPVAAASIAQVYRARLRDRAEDDTGFVAIKVQRPNLEETLLRDLDALIGLSGVIDRLVPRYRRSMVHKVAEEYVRRAKGELDFLSEARAIDQFADVMQSLPEFRTPGVRHELCTPRMLVMEWLEGTKLDSVHRPEELAALGFEPTTFARSMLRLQISMSYEHGFVHGDTHPGNVILLPSGQIALIDFGLHAHIPRALRDAMLEMIFYQASGRHAEAVENYVRIFKPDPASDIEGFKRKMTALLAEEGKTSAISDNRITEQLIKGMRIGASYRLEAPSELLMVLRNLAIVEGIVLRYAPSIDSDEEVKTIVGDIMKRKVFGPSMREEMTQLLPHVLLTLSQRPRLAERMLQLERAFNASKSLGEFLRHENVIAPLRPPRSSSGPMLLGVLIGAVLGFLLAGAL